jgi:hypothetical protein
MRRSGRAVVASALLTALVLCLDARSQDKKPDAGAAQQDRIDIGPILDSWYKVTQGPEAAGWVHEVLQRAVAGNPWRYQYHADAEVELIVTDPKDAKKASAHTDSLQIRAQLDDTFAPQSMARIDSRDDNPVMTNVVSEENNKRIDVVVGSDRKSFPVSADEEVHYSRFLMFISLRQNGKLSKAGTQRVLLLSPREDDQLPLAEVQLEVHEMVKREYMGKKDVTVTRVTYLKPPPAASRDAELLETFVDKFGRIVEETTRGGVKRVLVKDEVDAVGKNERVRPGARRDPFRKDLALLKPPTVGTGEGVKPIVITLDTMDATLKDVERLFDDLRKAKEEKRDDEGQVIYEKLLDIFAAIRKTNTEKALPPAVIARVDALRKQTEELWGGIDRLMKKLQGTYVKVMEAFKQDELGDMEKGIDELKKAQNRKELDDQPQLAQLLKWIGELEPLVGKCKTRIELAKKRIFLTGTLLHEDVQLIPVDASVSVFGHQVGGTQEVRFIKPNRIAVINDKMYRVGDLVEGEGVRIEKIWAFGVQVSLREETRDVGIRQK